MGWGALKPFKTRDLFININLTPFLEMEKLPIEIIQHIGSFLDDFDLRSLGSTSKVLFIALKDLTTKTPCICTAAKSGLFLTDCFSGATTRLAYRVDGVWTTTNYVIYVKRPLLEKNTNIKQVTLMHVFLVCLDFLLCVFRLLL